tara:strand:+ start:85 stop:357 length:273 start_codon:yes stop_codon:yes gene_type:complete
MAEEYAGLVGFSVIDIFMNPRFEGLYSQMTVKEFAELALLFTQPGIRFELILKVIFPGTEATAVILCGVRYMRFPASKEIVAEVIVEDTV